MMIITTTATTIKIVVSNWQMAKSITNATSTVVINEPYDFRCGYIDQCIRIKTNIPRRFAERSLLANTTRRNKYVPAKEYLYNEINKFAHLT